MKIGDATPTDDPEELKFAYRVTDKIELGLPVFGNTKFMLAFSL
jgi:hypothetical protein